MTDDRPASAQAPTHSEQARLTEYFAARHPASEVWLTDYKPSATGFSNETRFFRLHVREDGHTTSRALVARWAPTGQNRQFDSYDIAFQFRAMQALARNGIPVPEPILLEEDPWVVGGVFFVMSQVAGHGISDYPPGAHGAGYWFEASEANRARLWWRSLEIMTRVNGLDWRKPEFAFLDIPADGVAAVRKRLAFMRQQASAASSTPIEIFEQALAWLATHIPENPRLALCWSDPRPGNIVWQDYDVAAACDWEGMCVGPPENDLAWFILVDEIAYSTHGQARLQGLPETSETIARFEQLLGRKAEDLDYYMAFQCTLLAILMTLSVKAAIAKGIQMPADYATNNYSTQRLRQLLDHAAARR
jgi:aminoglycoside phosphotransferase (APT) family kinase protein